MKFIMPVFVIAIIALSACNSDSKKKNELIKQWKMVNMGGKGAERFTDSAKREMYGTRFMEFREEGDMIASGGDRPMQRGDYTVSEDGKSIITTRNGRASDTFVINKLTKDTLIVSLTRAQLELTWVPK